MERFGNNNTNFKSVTTKSNGVFVIYLVSWLISIDRIWLPFCNALTKRLKSARDGHVVCAFWISERNLEFRKTHMCIRGKSWLAYLERLIDERSTMCYYFADPLVVGRLRDLGKRNACLDHKTVCLVYHCCSISLRMSKYQHQVLARPKCFGVHLSCDQ